MPKFEITSPNGQKYEVNAPEGATEDDAIAYVQNNLVKSQEAKPKRSAPKELLRQAGLATRYLGEGLADTAGIFSDPLAGLSNRFLGTNLKSLRGATSSIGDNVGLPLPENGRERNVAEASRMLASTGGFIGGAKAGAQFLGKTGQAAANALAARPAIQASSAIGAGYAGGEAKEQGLSPSVQFGASLLGGLAVPSAVGVSESIYNSLRNKAVNPSMIDNALMQAGIDTQNMPTQAANSLRDDVQNALKTGDNISPDAIRRLADYKGVGATPLRGNLTLNPVDITRDKNLTKLAANSDDLVANQLPMIPNKNNAALIGGLNELGAGQADDTYSAGQKVISALNNRNDSANVLIDSLYKNARETNGRSAALDPYAFTNKANDLLDFHNAGGSLPADIRTKLNAFADGSAPLTVDTAEQFKTNIARTQRNSTDGNVKFALGKVREALDNTPLLDGAGQDATSAFNKARRVNRAYMQIVEKTPALQAVRDGIEPDKFVQKFIIGSGQKSNLMDLAMLKKNIKGSPEAVQSIRGQILNHLKSKGVNGAADEVANLSPAGYNKALEQIGERKLKLFFEPNEIEQLKRIGRVASYENFQPKGSAVNNSNTAAAMFTSVIDKIDKYIPFGSSIVGKPAKNIMINAGAKNTLNSANALTQKALREKMAFPIAPLLASSGLLASE